MSTSVFKQIDMVAALSRQSGRSYGCGLILYHHRANHCTGHRHNPEKKVIPIIAHVYFNYENTLGRVQNKKKYKKWSEDLAMACNSWWYEVIL